MEQCATYVGAPGDCPHPIFESVDGSTRCRGCHLHPDGCTCGPTVGKKLLRLFAVEQIVLHGTRAV